MFVHATIKMAGGRSKTDKKALCDEIFNTIKEHFADLFEKRYIALSMELYEFRVPTYKYNNIHARFKE